MDILPNSNSEASRPRVTLGKQLRDTVREHGDKTVELVDFEGAVRSMDYATLLCRAEALLARLRAAGLQSGDQVFLPVSLTESFLEIFWACVLGGVVAVPVALPPTGKRRNSVLERLVACWQTAPKTPMVCADGVVPELLADAGALYEITPPRFIVLSELDPIELSETEASEPDVDAPVVMMLTSGSTGRPKGVPLSHSNILARSAGTAQVNDFTCDEISFNWFPFDHVGSLVMFHIRDVFLGCRQIHAPTQYVLENPLAWFDWCNEQRVTATWAPNFAFGLINARADEVAKREWDLSRLRFIMNAGEAIVPRTVRRFLEIMEPHGLPPTAMVPAWGMSETSSAVLFNRGFTRHAVSDDDPAVCVGSAIPGTVVRITDEHDRPVPDGEVGHLQVRGTTCLREYFADPERTAESFTEDGWFRTGDEATLQAGEVTITGRKKDEIVVHGVNYAVHDIEAAVDEVTGVRPSFSAACQVVDPDSGTEVLAVFFSPQSAEADESELTGRVRERVVSRVGVSPRFVFCLSAEDIPKTSIGKIQRSVLRHRFERGEFTISSSPKMVESKGLEGADPVLKGVCAACGEALGIDGVRPEDDLFSLGADSLRAAAIIARLRRDFGVGVTLGQIFDAPVVSELADAVRNLTRQKETKESAAVLVPKPRSAGINEFPLSFPQERVWFLDRWQPGNAAYIELLRYDIDGPLVIERLRESIDRLVSRHEILRTSFPLRDGRPVQRVHPSLGYEFSVLDLSVEAHAEAMLETHAQKLSHQAFDQENGPCFRCCLVRLADERSALLFVVHHLLVDAWSLGVIMEEIRQGYDSDSVSPPLQVQYADFACMQRAATSLPEYDKQLYYWKTRLSGIEDATEFPPDKARPPRQSFTGHRVYRRFPADLSDRVKGVGAEVSASSFMVMLTAFQVLLYRYTGLRDLVVGSPVINRNEVALEPLIGFFANTLVFRGSIDPEDSFAAHVRRVRDTVLEGFANQDVPFERLVEELGAERDLSRTPLVQILFQSIEYPEACGETAKFKYREFDNHTAKFDLTVQVADGEDGLVCMCEYNTDLYEASTVERLLKHYEILLSRAVDTPLLTVNRLGMLDEAETSAILASGRGPRTDWRAEQCAHEVFEAHAVATPDAVAVHADGSRMTYAELNERADRLAGILVERGVESASVVALFLERGAGMIEAMLGVLKAGCAYLPVDPQYPEERIRYMLADSGCMLVITESGLLDRLAPSCPTLCLDGDEVRIAQKRSEKVGRRVSPESLAYIIYTSGSTGRPKGVCVRHRNLVHLVMTGPRAMPFGASDVWSVYHSYAFDFSVWELWSPLLSGGALAVVSEDQVQNPRRFVRMLAECGVTVVNLTPSALRQVLALYPEGLLSEGVPLRSLVVGGEAFPTDLARQVLGWNVPVYNFYGPTECTVWAASQRVDAENLGETGVVPLGRPLPDNSLYVLDADGQLLPVGVSGELCIGGAGVAAGYHGRPELTAERFVSDSFAADESARMYRTGDHGVQRDDGVFVFGGRADGQVKIRGYRVELGEVEARLRDCPGVKNAVVALVSGAARQEVLVAYVVGDIDEHACRQRLGGALPRYMVPQQFVRLDALPLNPHGKIDRGALPAPGRSAQASKHEHADDETVRELAAMWRKVIGVSEVHPEDDFFQIGGNSLLAVSLFERIREHWHQELPLAVLFEAPTLEALAGVIRDYSWHPQSPVLVPIQARGNRPPLFCVHGGGGHVLVYRDLSLRLGDEQPFYGLQLPELSSGAEPMSSLDVVGRVYLKELRTVQPHGPYFLGGVSYGGVIAYEMAQQLVASGEEVRLLAMFDTYAPGYPRYPERRHRLYERARSVQYSLEHHLRGLQWLPPEERWGYIARLLRRTARRTCYPFEDAWRLVRRIYLDAHGRAVPMASYKAMQEALKTYAPEPYNGDILLFRATRQPPGSIPDAHLGWDEYVQGGIDVVETPGYHADIISEPRVKFMIDAFREKLRAAQEGV